MMKQKTKELIRASLPLSLRKGLCIMLNRPKWINRSVQYWWTQELLRDYAETDRNGYHRFLWSHHLGYAESYDVDSRFGEGNMKESRRLFFSDLRQHLSQMGIDASRDVDSVLEVGCSLGYQLRHLETDIVPAATELDGIDIDRHAIERGTEYLNVQGSKVRLRCADMGSMGALLGEKKYDLVICTGVLMYLEEAAAALIVGDMLRHCRLMLALSGPAYPERDNSGLPHSAVRGRDGSFIHNIDRMVESAGGTIVARRWEGSRIIDGHTIYFVFATGARGPESPAV